MKLDLRRPTLVLVGAWNPAIFQPGWIAQHIFDVPAGVEVSAELAQIIADEQLKRVLYLHNVGFAVSNQRLELYAVDDKGSFQAVETVADKTLKILPHTPIAAYGINFWLAEDSPSPTLRQNIRGCDALYDSMNVISDTLISKIDFEPSVHLNLARRSDGSSLAFDFNFHRGGIDVKRFHESIHGEIQKRFQQALSIMSDVYGLASYEVLTHEREDNQEDVK